jgi:ketosteroid isomerase-like protein
LRPKVFAVKLCRAGWPKEEAAAQEKQADHERPICRAAEEFAEAYNRKDADAMAAAFAEDGIRVTPSGIFQGRDAIRRNLQEVLNMGLHDYTVQRTVSRGGPS